MAVLDQQINNLTWCSIIPLIGGLTLGAQNVLKTLPEYIISFDGFQDNDSHTLNHFKNDNIPYLNGDKLENIDKVDMTVMVPPCSALSNLNVKSDTEYESIKWLYISTKIAMEKCEAKVIIGENAPGLFTKKGKAVVDQLHQIGLEHGYSLSIFKIDSKYCNCPQQRLRSFFVFWKGDHTYELEPKCEMIKIDDYLKKTKLNMKYHNEKEEEDRLINSAQYKFIKYEMKQELSQFLDGVGFIQRLFKNNLIDKFEQFLINNKFDKDLALIKHIKYKLSIGKSFWDSYSIYDTHTRGCTNALTGKTIKTLLHPYKDRFLTNAELIAIMGLPFDYEIVNDKLIHITQNVTVQSAEFMVKECKKYFTNNLRKINSTLNYQDLTISDNIKPETIELNNLF